jgi:hypothetical protein
VVYLRRTAGDWCRRLTGQRAGSRLCARQVARVARARGARHRAQVGSHCLLCCIIGDENGDVEYWALLLSKDIERGKCISRHDEGQARARLLCCHGLFGRACFERVCCLVGTCLSTLFGWCWSNRSDASPRAMLSTHNASRSLHAINLKAVISAYDHVIQRSTDRCSSHWKCMSRFCSHQTFFGIHHLMARLL